MKKALDIIKGLTAEPEVGAIYKGTVQRITDFGAFVEILPGTDGLLHISEIAHTRVEQRRGRPEGGRHRRGEGHLSVDRDGKIRLTRRELLPFPEGEEGERRASGSSWRAKPACRREAADAIGATGRRVTASGPVDLGGRERVRDLAFQSSGCATSRRFRRT